MYFTNKIFTNLERITKSTCVVKATDVGYGELALVDGRPAQVVKIMSEEITLQVLVVLKVCQQMRKWFFPVNLQLVVGNDLAGRFLMLLVYQ